MTYEIGVSGVGVSVTWEIGVSGCGDWAIQGDWQIGISGICGLSGHWEIKRPGMWHIQV